MKVVEWIKRWSVNIFEFVVPSVPEDEFLSEAERKLWNDIVKSKKSFVGIDGEEPVARYARVVFTNIGGSQGRRVGPWRLYRGATHVEAASLLARTAGCDCVKIETRERGSGVTHRHIVRRKVVYEVTPLRLRDPEWPEDRSSE